MDNEKEIEISIKDIFRIFKRGLWIIVTTAVVFGIIACKMFEYNIETAQNEFINQNKNDEEIIYLLRNIANIEK